MLKMYAITNRYNDDSHNLLSRITKITRHYKHTNKIKLFWLRFHLIDS